MRSRFVTRRQQLLEREVRSRLLATVRDLEKELAQVLRELEDEKNGHNATAVEYLGKISDCEDEIEGLNADCLLLEQKRDAWRAAAEYALAMTTGTWLDSRIETARKVES